MATATDDAEHVERPLVVEGLLERRDYQLRLAETAAADHALVCLPTGLGKTAVSLLVTAERLAEAGGTSNGADRSRREPTQARPSAARGEAQPASGRGRSRSRPTPGRPAGSRLTKHRRGSLENHLAGDGRRGK